MTSNNPFIEHIKSHRSVREYLPQEVSEEVLQEILEAGVRASSSGNMQAFSIIVTKDPDIKAELSPLHFNQPMVDEAPALLTFCADFNRMRKWLKLSKAPENFDNFMSFMIAAIDATLASQNCALAAEAHGLGVCYMGTTLANAHLIGPVLGLPKNVIPIVGFSLGYPKSTPNKKDRLPLDSLVHYDRYEDYKDEEIKELYSKREVDGMRRYRNVPRLKKMIEESDVENLAQVYTKIKYTRESHLTYSNNLLNYLKEQEFFVNDNGSTL